MQIFLEFFSKNIFNFTKMIQYARRGVVEQHWCREIHTNSTVPHSSSRMGSANMHFIVH